MTTVRAYLKAKRAEHTPYVVGKTSKKRCQICLSIWPCEQSQILDLALSAEDKASELRFIEQLAHAVYADELANNYGGLGYELRPAGLAVAEVMRTAEGYRKALVEQGLLQKTASGAMVWHAHDCPASFDFDECNYRCRVARAALEETR